MKLLRSLSVIDWLAIVAGMAYCTWPLGPLLNPVAARGLASQLEVPGQPFGWVFAGGNVLAGACTLAVCVLLLCKEWQVNTVLLGGLLFSAGIIGSVLVPEHCLDSLQQCPSFTQDHALLVHGVLSGVTTLGLFVALCGAWLQRRRDVVLGGLLLANIFFGTIATIGFLNPAAANKLSQYCYITVCSAMIVALPYAHRITSAQLTRQQTYKS